jgi:uncharacterized protein YodC (DUF2158 family)
MSVRLKSGGALMTVSKLFKSPEGREINPKSTEPHL